MKEFLKFLDIWGTNMKIQVNRQKNFTSWQAGTVCLFYYSIVLAYTIAQLYYFFNEFYVKKHSQMNYTKYPELNIKDFQQFMLAFCHGTADNSSERDPIAHEAVYSTLEWHYNIRNPWLFEDKIYINLTECNKNDFPDFIRDTYTLRIFNKCKCASYKHLKDYNISYFFTDSYYTYMAYKLNFKDEILNNQTLYEYYSDYYRNNSQRLFTYFVDSQGNLDNDNDPFADYINYDYSYLSPDFSIVSDLFFSPIKMMLDYNILVDSPETIGGITLENTLYKPSPYLNNFKRPGKTMLQVRFRASPKYYVITKSVTKLYEFIAYIFSVNFMIFQAFRFINEFVNNFQLKKTLIYGLFKNFDVNTKIMTQLKIIQGNFNEIEYKNNPDFQEIDQLKQVDGSDKFKSEDCLIKDFKVIETNYGSIKEFEYNVKKFGYNNTKNNKKIIENHIQLDQLYKDYDKNKVFEELYNETNRLAFKFSLSDMCCKYIKIRNFENLEKSKQYFEDASSVLDYYTDAIVYLKKMLEIEIMKYYLFTKEERKLVSILSNPDFLSLDREYIEKKIETGYQKDRFTLNNMDEIFTKILKDGRNNMLSNKLLQLVQLGNHKLFYSDEI